MIRIALLLISIGLTSLQLSGQDEGAKKILDKISKQYNSYDNISLAIDMLVTIPEEKPIKNKVEVVQSAGKFRIIHPDQEIYCDGNDVWMYIPDQNEVQINDYDPEEEVDYVLTPKDLLQQYQSGKYKYQMASKKGSLAQIEFLPNDMDSDYAKYRIQIETKKSEVLQMWAFGKDGSLIELTITDFKSNQALGADIFSFDVDMHPNVRVEDLRLD